MLLRRFLRNKILMCSFVYLIITATAVLIIKFNSNRFCISGLPTEQTYNEGLEHDKVSIREASYSLAPRVLKKLKSALEKFKRTDILNLGETLDIYQFYNESGDDTGISWKKFLNKIQRYRLYSEEDNLWKDVIWAMQTKRITTVNTNSLGSEFKFFMTLEDGLQVIVKPQRLSVETDAPIDMNKNDFLERFQSEVAAFHLSRILGFYHVPPATSRYINITRDILENPLAPSSLKESVHLSPDGRTCFGGTWRRNKGYTLCGNPTLLAASVGFIIPETVQEFNWVYVFGHNNNSDACKCMESKMAKVNNAPKRFLDLIDVNIFDFIQGNPDRHHFSRLKNFGNDTNVILFDNGRGFSRALLDEIDFLVLLPKCCTIRHSTLKNLLAMANSREGLSGALRQSFANEIVQPLLNERHLLAIDRRLLKVLEIIYLCIRATDSSYTGVNIIDDGF